MSHFKRSKQQKASLKACLSIKWLNKYVRKWILKFDFYSFTANKKQSKDLSDIKEISLNVQWTFSRRHSPHNDLQ